jgi:putative FmdB family regulatory protein
MPLYEYVCKQCGHRFESLIIGSRQPVCPSCSGCDLEQVFSSFSTSSGSKGNGTHSIPARGGCGPGPGGG